MLALYGVQHIKKNTQLTPETKHDTLTAKSLSEALHLPLSPLSMLSVKEGFLLVPTTVPAKSFTPRVHYT